MKKLPSTLLASALVLLVAAPRWAHAQPAEPEYVLDGSRVFWWVQLSDTHVDSLFPGNDERMNWVVDEGIPTVAPDFVVTTGDLTDSTNGIIYGFGPYEDEWTKYRQYIDRNGWSADYYFDLPGNHDQYGDGSLAFYRTYSIWGSETDGTQPYWTAEYDFGRYLFFGTATPGNDGAQWPFDNATYADWELEELASVLEDEAATSDLIFLFGHHDYREVENVEQMLALVEPYGVRLYIHGHEHTHMTRIDDTNGIVRYQIASVGQSGDDNFGIWAVDANAVSVAVRTAREAWPAIVVTAPVDALLLDDVENPYAPPVPNTCTEAPVRALVFDTGPLDLVRFWWDDGDSHEMTQSPAMSAQWRGLFDATLLTPGPHELTVEATGSESAQSTIQVEIVEAPCELGEPDTPADPGPPGDAGGPDLGPPPDAGGPDTGAPPEPDLSTVPEDASLSDSIPAPDSDVPELVLDVQSSDQTVTPGADESSAGVDDGCGCRAQPAGGGHPLVPSLMLVLLVLTHAARRRRARSPNYSSPVA